MHVIMVVGMVPLSNSIFCGFTIPLILMFFSRLFSVILSLAILHYQKGAWSQSPPGPVGEAKRNQEEYIDRYCSIVNNFPKHSTYNVKYSIIIVF
jgi:hypothetical protein